ncbi:AMP-binding domain containing protein, partial [Asbolus verrucosus]
IDGTTGKSETYASVKQRSTRLAIELQKRGITHEDVIVFCSSNTLDVVIPMLATFYMGAKVANLEPSLSVTHTKHLLTLVVPKIIFVEEASFSLIEKSLEDTNFQSEVIVFGHSRIYSTFSNLMKPQENEKSFRPVDVDIHEIALIQCGVRGAVLHFTTMYWMTAMIMLTCSFKSGNYKIFCRNPRAEDTFTIIAKYKLTDFENAKKYDVSSVRLVLLGGTSMASFQFEKVNDLFKSAIVTQAYGMSEVGMITSFTPELDEELVKKKLGSSGKPSPGLCIKVVDPDTRELVGSDQKGEICITTPSMMKGYYKMDNSHVFVSDGSLKTGDIGYYDKDGCVYIIETIKEMFKYQSCHIIPSSIEAVLLEHFAIKEAVVFGIPREMDGEIPAACIILKDECSTSEEEINEFVEKRVSNREKLRGGITFVKTLPKTPSGKVIRREVRDFVIKSNA